MANQIEEVGLRLRADGVLETSKGMQVTADAVKQLGAAATAADKPLKDLGISAGQTRQAFRQLPAQITDIVSGLATGQSAFTVAIQQGGQIKDSFGGIVPAGRALISLLNPLTVALGGTAIAAGALGLAYTKGAAEQDEFARSIILTGNAAGVTVSQMVSMAEGIDAIIGTQGQASEVLAQLGGTALVAGHNMEKFGELAIRMERVTGQSIETTVKTFADLGRAPLQASIKLNEATNFMTVSLYEQIRALQEQGRTAEAASVAQNAYADAMKPRLEELQRRLGLIETAWSGIKSIAAEAWDAMLGIGRQQTLQQQLAAAEKQLAEMPAARRGTNPLQGDSRREAIKARIADLRMQVYMEGEVAAAESAAADSTKRRIAEREKDKDKAAKGPSAADKALAERIALMQKIYGGPDGSRQLRQDNFRSSELAGTDATNAAMQKAAGDAAEQRAKALAQAAQAAERDATALEREVATLANQTAEIGLNEAALLLRRQALADQQIAEAAAQLAVIEGAQGYEAQTAALQRQIAALEQLKLTQAQAFEKQGAEAMRKTAADREQQEQQEATRRTERIADSIEEGLMSGFRKGSSVADIFLNELKAQFARTVLRPFIQPIAAMGGGGGGGLLSGLLSLFSGGGSSVAPEFTTGLPMPGFARPGEGWHGGGVTGSDSPAFMRSLPAATWRNAPRFHTGIGPDEVPAVLQRKEGVFTEGQMKAMAPVSALSKAAGGARITYSPTFNVDSRSDRAQVLADMKAMTQQAQAELLDMMDRRMA